MQHQPARRCGGAGITLPELLVVIAIIALAVMVAVPFISQAVNAARIRASADHFAVTVRAVRMIAVTRQAPVDLIVETNPTNEYRYVDMQGRTRRFETPRGVRIVSSTSPISFRANGSLAADATTRFEADAPGAKTQHWEIRTNLMGVSKVIKDVAP